MLAGALKINEDALANIKRLQEVTTKLEAETERQRATVSEMSHKLDEFLESAKTHRRFTDAALCRLDVKVPNGCPDVEYEPEPMAKSKAPRIQPKVRVEPLP